MSLATATGMSALQPLSSDHRQLLYLDPYSKVYFRIASKNFNEKTGCYANCSCSYDSSMKILYLEQPQQGLYGSLRQLITLSHLAALVAVFSLSVIDEYCLSLCLCEVWAKTPFVTADAAIFDD